MPRRRSRYSTPGPRAGSVLLDTGRGGARRRRRRRRGGGVGWGRIVGWLIVVLVLLGAVAGGVYLWRSHEDAAESRRKAAEQFAAAWQRGDHAAMWRELSPSAQAGTPARRFVTAYRNADRAAGVEAVKVGKPGPERDGRIALPVAVRTDIFGTLRGTMTLRVSGTGDDAGVDWSFALRLPGLRSDEAVVRSAGPEPRRGALLAADGSRMEGTAIAAGLQKRYADRLEGHPSARLRFGDRIVARTRAVKGRPVRTTIDPALSRAAAAALGGKVGGIAVIRPRDGAVRALAGLAVSAPQPPGSTFKIITTAAALQHRVATPSTTYPVQTAATLSGVQLRNASGEACGGTLQEAFAESCNSVFAPLGAKVGARRLVAAARAFGFNEEPRIPEAKMSTISAAADLKDSLAVGAAAIGQDRDLATPLAMASVGATIATGGPPRPAADHHARPRHPPPRGVGEGRPPGPLDDDRRRALGHRHGGRAARASQVAGKTGTAELRPNSSDPKDADAWFVAFAPAERPRVAVAVMLVGAGFGGTAAAPIARETLQAALG